MNQLPTPPRGYSFRPGPLVRLVKVDVVGLQPFLLRAQIVLFDNYYYAGKNCSYRPLRLLLLTCKWYFVG
jgi:hypothetical protein